MFIITHNIIDEQTPVKITPEQRSKFPYFFRLYDDDNELYFEGYSDDDSSFEPLDSIGQSYGCTGLKYRNAKTNCLEFL
jgi:hypothetical protein